MAEPTRTFSTASGKTFHVCMNVYAITRIERELCVPFHEVGSKMAAGKIGINEMAAILFGALEGGRVRTDRSKRPYTLEDACEILEDVTDHSTIFQPIMESFAESNFVRNQTGAAQKDPLAKADPSTGTPS